MKKPIYLDYNSTTPLDPGALAAMMPYLTQDFGNPSNMMHAYGWTANNAVAKATAQVTQFLNCLPQEITWNAGSTEGNNSVFWGLIKTLKLTAPLQPIHFITSAIEHPSVLKAFEALTQLEGITYSVIPVDSEGFVDFEKLKSAITPATKLISLMWVNNEIGTIQNISKIAELCQDSQIYFHTDATQALGKVDIDLKTLPIHFLTASAHKIYGPKGVGFLYTRKQNPYVEITPLIMGGGQQAGQRSGTLNVPGIVGAGQAIEILKNTCAEENRKTAQLCQLLFSELQKHFPDLKLNGPALNSKKRSAMNLSLTFPRVSFELCLQKLTGLAFSQSSACHSGGTSTSATLKAIGLSPEDSASTLRLSTGRLTTEADIYAAVDILTQALKP